MREIFQLTYNSPKHNHSKVGTGQGGQSGQRPALKHYEIKVDKSQKHKHNTLKVPKTNRNRDEGNFPTELSSQKFPLYINKNTQIATELRGLKTVEQHYTGQPEREAAKKFYHA